MKARTDVMEIRRPVAVAVEGQDYFHSILSIVDGPEEFDAIQLWDYTKIGTPEKWLSIFKTLKDFPEKIRAVAFIADAEDSSDVASAKLQNAFRRAGLSVPPKTFDPLKGRPTTAFLVMPHNRKSGCLEHAILESAEQHPKLTCADNFLICCDEKHRNDNWRAKVKVHALIAGSDKPSISLGQSVVARHWDLSHPSLAVIPDFLRAIATE